jgi:hypothetical protein
MLARYVRQISSLSLSLTHTHTHTHAVCDKDFLFFFFLRSCNVDLQRFAAFLSPLTLGRVNIAVDSVYISKVYCKAFSSLVNTEKVLLMNLTNIIAPNLAVICF